MQLFLIRHGQTPSNVGGLLDTALPGAPLTELGQEQARELVTTLAGQPVGVIFASAAVRAQQTAAPLAADRGLQVQVRQALKEVAAGDWEMLGDEESVEGYMNTIGTWMEGDLEPATPGSDGETGWQVLERFDGVIDEVAAAGDPAVVVAHGALIRFWVSARGRDLPAGYALRHGLHNTGMVQLTGDPSTGWSVRSWSGLRGTPDIWVPGAAETPDGQVDGPTDEEISAPGPGR